MRIAKKGVNRLAVTLYDLARGIEQCAKEVKTTLSGIVDWIYENKGYFAGDLEIKFRPLITGGEYEKLKFTVSKSANSGFTTVKIRETSFFRHQLSDALLNTPGYAYIDQIPDIDDVLQRYIVLAAFAEEKREGEDLELVRMTDALRHVRAAKMALKGDRFEIVINSLLDLDEMLSEAICEQKGEEK